MKTQVKSWEQEIEDMRTSTIERIGNGIRVLNEKLEEMFGSDPGLRSAFKKSILKKGDPYSSFYGIDPREATANYHHGKHSLVLYRFGYATDEHCANLILSPDLKIELAANVHCGELKCFYQRPIQGEFLSIEESSMFANFGTIPVLMEALAEDDHLATLIKERVEQTPAT